MKEFKEKLIVGIDHGYGNIKTANHCFKTGIMGYDTEPLFTKDMLEYGGRYYLIGEGHKEFLPDKIKDEDYYLLTLVAIAEELKDKGLTEADVIIAAGLPLTWTSGQKSEFAAYLSKNEEVNFTYQHTAYHIRICGVRIYPQGYAAVAEFVTTMKGLSVVADIGNGTMNTLFLTNGRPMSSKMYTEKFGTYQCTLAIREEFMQKTRREINDVIIDEVLQNGTADIPAADLKIIKTTATEYVKDIFRRLREHGYDEGTMTLYITGGGGCLVKNFYKCNPDRVKFVDDICAAAKGYEYMVELQLKADDAVLSQRIQKWRTTALEDEVNRLEFTIEHSYDTVTVFVDTLFLILITVLQLAEDLLSPDLRHEARNIEQFVSDYRFLQREEIHTIPQLEQRISDTKAEIATLELERSKTDNARRRAHTPEEVQAAKDERAAITEKIRPLREKVKRAEKIMEKSPHLYELLQAEFNTEREANARAKNKSKEWSR